MKKGTFHSGSKISYLQVLTYKGEWKGEKEEELKSGRHLRPMCRREKVKKRGTVTRLLSAYELIRGKDQRTREREEQTEY